MLHKIIEFSVVFILKIIRMFSYNKGAVLISPPIPMSNLGDQALLIGGIEGLISEGFDKILVVNSDVESSKTASYSSIKNSSKVFYNYDLSMAFVTSKALKERLKFYFTVIRYSNLYIVGADIIDGTYGGGADDARYIICKNLSRLGFSNVILGSSVSKRITPVAEAALRNMSPYVKFFARDKFSQERLNKIVTADLSADIAFLMNPEQDFIIEKLYGNVESTNARRIGLCIKINELGNDEEYLENYLRFCKDIYYQYDASIYFIPHYPTDYTTVKKLYTLLKSEQPSIECFLPSEFPTAPIVKSVVSTMDCVITGRMHVAIASLGTGVPVLGLAYGDKFEGLLSHFDLSSDYLIEDKTLADSSKVLLKLQDVLERNQELKDKIKSQLPNVIKLAQSNFSSF